MDKHQIKSMLGSKEFVIALDFDGTLVTHSGAVTEGATEYMIGNDIGAFSYLRSIQYEFPEVKFILLTMRDDEYDLTAAVEHCEKNGLKLWGINENPHQEAWSESRKVHANMYIDDLNCGIALVYAEEVPPYVDWDKVYPVIRARLLKHEW